MMGRGEEISKAWGLFDEATGGVVTRSYVTNLRKGRIKYPGNEKMRAIARVMGFPPEAWFEKSVGDVALAGSPQGHAFAGSVEHLFGDIRNPKTGEPYTNTEVARMKLGISRRTTSRKTEP